MTAKKSRSLRQAINAHCRSCVYDSQAPGTWLAQVTLCPCTGCELYGVRPTTEAIADSVYEYYGEEPPVTPRETLKKRQFDRISDETGEFDVEGGGAHMSGRKYPPYGRQYLEQRASAGIWVAIGPTAWKFAKARTFPVMVLPEDRAPKDFDWPSNGQPALIQERGGFNDERLYATAEALILAGAPCVVAIREALLNQDDPRAFFDPVHDNESA